MITPALGLKTIPNLLDTNSTHTGIAYVHLTAPQTCDYMGYECQVGHAARSSKNHQWLLGLEYTKFSLHEKWNNAHILIELSSPNGLNTIDRSRIHPWAWPLGFSGRKISYKIHSLNFIWAITYTHGFIRCMIFLVSLLTSKFILSRRRQFKCSNMHKYMSM